MAHLIYRRPEATVVSNGTNKLYITDWAALAPNTNRNIRANNVFVQEKDTVLVVATGWLLECTKTGRIAWPSAGNYAFAYYKKIGTEPILCPDPIAKLTSPTRNGNEYTAKWAAANTKADNPRRPTSLCVTWEGNYLHHAEYPEGNATSSKYTIYRANYYPFTVRKLTALNVSVEPRNNSLGFGNGSRKATKASYKFKIPRTPTIDAFKFNTATGTASTKIKTNAGKDAAERYDTRYTCYVYNAQGMRVAKVADTSSTSTEISVSWDAEGYQSLGYNDYFRIVVKAWARGLAGDSKVRDKDYYVSYPARVTVKKVSVSSNNEEGRCTLQIDTNSTKQHPVDAVELEYLADTSYMRYQDIPGTAEWTSSGVVDDAQCTALSIPTTNLIPSPGKRTWIRVKSWHANEDILCRYSIPQYLKDLETPAPTAADESISVLDASPSGSNAVLVTLGWNKNGTDDATGTEISWSESEDTWKSTEDPNNYTFTWSDGRITHKGVTYRDSAKITIKNLKEGQPVYICARRYLENESGTTWSDYSDTYMYIPYAGASNVVASASQYVAAGDSLEVSWTFGSYAYQTKWQIMRTDGLVIANGEGVASSCQIPASRLNSVAVNGSFSFTVMVSTGSGWTSSETHTVSIVEPPTLEIAATPITAQPYTIALTCSTNASLLVTATSQGVAGTEELGIGRQPAGDVVYSEAVTPEWNVSGSNYTASVELPICDFRDGGEYMFSVTAQDTVTGLETAAEETIAVDWAHKAPIVDECVVLTAVDETSENGVHTQAVRISLTPPQGSAETDVFDVYRLAGGNAVLVGESLPLTSEWTDLYAPFGMGECSYRVAVRTADGDFAYADFGYFLYGLSMRFDWGGNSLELPYNLSISDSYSKDVELRQHMDGSTDAYWNRSVTRKASLSSDLLRLNSPREIELARMLGQYPGSVFVRTPDGSAYEADVQVSDMSTTGTVQAVSVDAVEVNATGAFVLEEVEDELGA